MFDVEEDLFDKLVILTLIINPTDPVLRRTHFLNELTLFLEVSELLGKNGFLLNMGLLLFLDLVLVEVLQVDFVQLTLHGFDVGFLQLLLLAAVGALGVVQIEVQEVIVNLDIPRMLELLGMQTFIVVDIVRDHLNSGFRVNLVRFLLLFLLLVLTLGP